MNQSVSGNLRFVFFALAAAFVCLLGGLKMAEHAGAASVFDQSFGTKGRVQTNLSYRQVEREGYLAEFSALPDGKFIAAFISSSGFDTMTILRFRADGTRDVSFGQGGAVRPGFGSELALLDSGKILVSGQVGTGTPGQDIAVRRYDTDGSIDRSFGRKGQTVIDLGAQDSVGQLVVTSDGKIALGANSFCHATERVCYDSTSDHDFLLLLDQDGKLLRRHRWGEFSGGLGGITAADDGTLRGFRSDGENADVNHYRWVKLDQKLRVSVIRNFGTDADWRAPASMLPGNGLYAFASEEIFTDSVVKVKPNGEIDTGFGEGGKATCETEGFGGPNSGGAMLKVDGQGRVLARGSSEECRLFRILPDGDLDPAFGDGGVIKTFNQYETWDFAPTGDGRVLLARWDYESGKLIIRRLEEDGTDDDGFGVKKVLIPQASADSAKDVISTSKGLVVGGNSHCSGSNEVCQSFALARYRPDGSLDSGFGAGGRVFGSFMGIESLTRLPDGKILAAGGAGGGLKEPEWGGRPGFALARFTANGRLDPSFGDGGIVRAPLPNGNLDSAQALDADILSNGKIVVTGEDIDKKHGTAEYLPVMRFTRNGTLDESFGGDGIVELELTDLELGNAVKALPDGKILIAGRDYYDAIVLRLKKDGELDQSFGKDGIARPKFPVRSRFNEKTRFPHEWVAGALTVLRDGSMVVGAGNEHGFMDGVVFRLSPDGKLVRKFGRKGLAFTAGLMPRDITVDRCRRLTVSGGNRKVPRASARFGVLRLRSGGGADRGFNRGRTILPFGTVERSKASAATLSRGRVIVAGTTSGVLTNDDFALAGFAAQKKCK